MSDAINPRLIAARIRCLVGSNGRSHFETVAARLGVTELALRISTDELSPHPSIEVIVACVRHYGIDPAWLVLGEYDAALHRSVLGDGADPSESEVTHTLVRWLGPVEASALPGVRSEMEI